MSVKLRQSGTSVRRRLPASHIIDAKFARLSTFLTLLMPPPPQLHTKHAKHITAHSISPEIHPTALGLSHIMLQTARVIWASRAVGACGGGIGAVSGL